MSWIEDLARAPGDAVNALLCMTGHSFTRQGKTMVCTSCGKKVPIE